ncbi:hypothetical protein KP509_18G031100 [Ceratopteris richardii]|nr:hypothetical protein KP509_18G031100 [Ceratopteris richardii]
MLSAYALAELKDRCLISFYEMLQQDFKPDKSTFLCILNVCASLMTLDVGRIVHFLTVEASVEQTIDISNAIMNMYNKCGCINDSQQVLRSMHACDTVSWNTMIAGFAQSGYGFEALQLLHEMEELGANMDYVTLVELLYACSHAGILDVGILLLFMLENEHGVRAGLDHCTGLLDLFGRTGRLDEAFNFVDRIPFQPSGTTWKSLLSGCRIHNDLRRAHTAAEFVVDLEPHCDAAYLLLYNTSAIAIYDDIIWQ